MKKENMRSEGAVLRSSVKKYRWLLSAATVLLICCLVFVGVAGAQSTNLPTATVTDLTEDERNNAPPLSFALNFTNNNYDDDTYDNWLADFVLTINKDINASSLAGHTNHPYAEAYISGSYEAYQNGMWITLPGEEIISVPANTPIYIIASVLAAEQEYKEFEYGVPYWAIKNYVKTFLCGMYLTDTYLVANPDLEITLELRLTNNLDNNENYTIAYSTFTSPVSTITLKDKDGGNTLGEITKVHDREISTDEYPSNPERIGYQFDGWSESLPDKMPTEDLTITAKWEPITYHVVFHNNTGEGIMNGEQFYYDDKAVLPENTFTKIGYTFSNWNTKADGSGLSYSDKSSENLAESNGATVNLYARWNPNTYAVKFNANSGIGEMTDQTFTYDDAQSLTANAFTRDGYTFNGWNTVSSGSGIAYSDKQNVQNLTAKNGDTVTLYAQWKENEKSPTVTPDDNKPNRVITTTTSTKTAYQVVFYPNGGSGEMNAVVFVEGEEKAIPANTFTRNGYTFKGWSLTSGGEVFYTDGELVLIDETTYLYAVWEEVAPETPSDEPTGPETPETPAPLFVVLAGLGAAVVLRRK